MYSSARGKERKKKVKIKVATLGKAGIMYSHSSKKVNIMTTKTKAVNYTPEMVAQLEAGYTGKDNAAEVAALVEATGKSKSSIVSKLGQMKIYVKEVKAKSASGKSTKTAKVEAIAKIIGLSEIEQEGLVKATAGPLEKILNALNEASEEASED